MTGPRAVARPPRRSRRRPPWSSTSAERRAPRIADLVDRVSDRLPREPIEGKTVKARTVAWVAAAPSIDHVTLGRLLATPWPGRWSDALTLVKALDHFRDDPRIAVSLARLLAAPPFRYAVVGGRLHDDAAVLVARHSSSFGRHSQSRSGQGPYRSSRRDRAKRGRSMGGSGSVGRWRGRGSPVVFFGRRFRWSAPQMAARREFS